MPRKKAVEIEETIETEATETAEETVETETAAEPAADNITEAEPEAEETVKTVRKPRKKKQAEETLPESTEEPTLSEQEAESLSRREVVAEKRRREEERAERNRIKEEKIMNWEGLRNARKDSRIVYGRIVSIETMNETTVVAVASVGEFRVVIPISELYKEQPLDTSTVRNTKDKVRRENQMLSKLLGLEIPFIITEISGNMNEDYAIIGSRKRALERISSYNFRKNQTGQALVNVGDVVDATVISAGYHSIFANVKGVDVTLQAYQLTHRYVGLVKDSYHTGDIISVEIKDIEYDADGSVSKLLVSGKSPEIQSFIPKLKHINRHSRYLGRITSIRSTSDGKTRINLFLDDAGVPAIALSTKIDNLATAPRTGDTCLFEIVNKNEDSGFVTGKIIQRVKTA